MTPKQERQFARDVSDIIDRIAAAMLCERCQTLTALHPLLADGRRHLDAEEHDAASPLRAEVAGAQETWDRWHAQGCTCGWLVTETQP